MFMSFYSLFQTQNEISSKVGSDKEVEKEVAATFDCSLEYFDGQVEDVTLSGTAVLLRRRSNSPARLIKSNNKLRTNLSKIQ